MQAPQSLVGSELVGFKLVRALGAGGMAAVYEGANVLDPSIRRAIKVVHGELSGRPEFVQRFAEEARVLERLTHPNVVRFYGVRREQGKLVMELELLEGQGLDEVLASNQGTAVEVGQAVEWIRQSAEGVAAAHRLGIVHRDLKPENLYLTQDGSVKVLDFGIARALDEADRQVKATRGGTVPGTPAYMAPEVCDGGVPSAGADVYALGLSLYTLLMGHHPFLPPGEKPLSDIQLMFAQASRELAPLRQFRPEASPALEQVLRRAVAKDPAQRFASAQELADALEGIKLGTAKHLTPTGAAGKTSLALPTFNSGHDTVVPAAGPSSSGVRVTTDPPAEKSKLPLIVGGVVAALALVGGGVAFALREPEVEESPAQEDLGPPPVENLWVTVEPPRRTQREGPLILGQGKRSQANYGFLSDAGVTAPTVQYQIQQHEVSWGELEPWLEDNPAQRFALPEGLPAQDARRELPASGVPWTTASAYCLDLGGTLPSEEQWEYAARGPELRPWSWGSQPFDPMGTNAFRGEDWELWPIMSSPQDRTPGASNQVLYEMTGNVREWTADLYRMNEDGKAPAFVTRNGNSIRGVRGLPVKPKAEGEDPYLMPAAGAAWRTLLCASGDCVESTDLSEMGFRCVRPVPGEGG